MTKKLILVDFENRPNLDLSILDSSYTAIIFVGHLQEEPHIKKKIARKNRVVLVDYQKVDGVGKNGLDFHIAFKLGQIYETEPDTHCYILSGDKGFDPLLKHFKNIGFNCRRVEAITDLPTTSAVKYGLNEIDPELTICIRCKKANTIEHNGGRWCTNCGRFASPPKEEFTKHLVEYPELTNRSASASGFLNERNSGLTCCSCHQGMGTGDGIYDDGEWTCWACLGV